MRLCSQLPSEHTLRDYRHSSPSTVGFFKATDLDFLDAIEQQKPRQLVMYITVILDEMSVTVGEDVHCVILYTKNLSPRTEPFSSCGINRSVLCPSWFV